MNKYGKRRMAEKRDVQNQRDFGKYFALIVVIVFTVFIGRFLYIAETKKLSGNNLVDIMKRARSRPAAERSTMLQANRSLKIRKGIQSTSFFLKRQLRMVRSCI